MRPESLAKKIYKFYRSSGFDVNWATAFMEYGIPEGSFAMRVSYRDSKIQSSRHTYGAGMFVESVTAGFIFVTPSGGVVIKGKDKKGSRRPTRNAIGVVHVP
jgi:hypothetical protein